MSKNNTTKAEKKLNLQVLCYEERNVDDLIPHPRNNEFFDDVQGEQWEEMLASVHDNGLIEPIIITDSNIIVSGHQRIRACRELGIQKVNCQVCLFKDEDAVIEALLDANVKQRGVIGGSILKSAKRSLEYRRLFNIKLGINQLTIIDSDKPTNNDELANFLHMSKRTMLREISVEKNLTNEGLRDKLEDNKITITSAEKLSQLSSEEQAEIDKKIEENNTYSQKDIQKYIDEIKGLKQTNQELNAELNGLKNKEPEIVEVEKLVEVEKDNTAELARIAELEKQLSAFEEKYDLLNIQSQQKIESIQKEADSKIQEILATTSTVTVESEESVNINSNVDFKDLFSNVNLFLDNASKYIYMESELIDVEDMELVRNIERSVNNISLWVDSMRIMLNNVDDELNKVTDEIVDGLNIVDYSYLEEESDEVEDNDNEDDSNNDISYTSTATVIKSLVPKNKLDSYNDYSDIDEEATPEQRQAIINLRNMHRDGIIDNDLEQILINGLTKKQIDYERNRIIKYML